MLIFSGGYLLSTVEWPPEHPILMRFKTRRCSTLEQVQAWVQGERRLARATTDKHGPTPTRPEAQTKPSVRVHEGLCLSVPSSAQLAANAALSLLNLCRNLLKRQLEAQAAAFENEGGFTERLYRVRNQRRSKP